MTTIPTTITSSSSSSSSSTTKLASLLKLLPTGTVFLFQFLNPVLSNNGNCDPSNKILTSVLIAVCGLSCVVSSFTHSYTDKDGNHRYGFVTRKGLILFNAPIPSSSDPDYNSNEKLEKDEGGLTDAKYKLTIADFIHAVLAVVVFCTVVVLDSNTAESCFPSIKSSEDTLMSVLPVAAGSVTAAVVKFFPYSRHGLGYTSLSSSSSSNSSSSGSSSSDSSTGSSSPV